MAKSTRSKVKRSFRAKKREDSVYASVEAARLQRLNAKLQVIRETEAEGEGEDAEEAGSSWFLLLGLLDPGTIDVERMGKLQEKFRDSIVDAY